MHALLYISEHLAPRLPIHDFEAEPCLQAALSSSHHGWLIPMVEPCLQVALSSFHPGLLYYIHRQRCWVVGLCDSRTFPGEWITTQGKFLFHRKE